MFACTSARAQSSPIVVHEGVTCLREELLDAQLEPGIAGVLADESLTLRIDGSAEDPRTAVIRLQRADELVAERTFSPGPPRCADFHAAIAVTVGIMVRSVSVEPPTAEPPPPPPPPPALPRPPPPKAREVVPFSAGVRASGVLGWGVEAARTRGFAVALELGGLHWALRAGGLATFSHEASFRGLEAGYATKLRGGSVDACWRVVRTQRTLTDLCAGLLVGSLGTRGVSGPDSQTLPAKDHTWAALRAELSFAVRLVGNLWALATLSPMRSLLPLTLTAEERPGEAVAKAVLPRNGVLLGLGLAYEFHRQGFALEGHR